ncbi:MAG: PKD domain-containing protein [Ferruginibacter sp.]
MRKYILLALVFFTSFTTFGQDFSNKGKDFWISYPEHINSTNSIMGLYITSDINTTGTISVNGTNIPFTVTANNITPRFLTSTGTGPLVVGLNTYVHLGGLQDGIKTNAAIHVVSLEPVVVYAHIIFSARSGSSLILPTTVWGKEYVVPSYPNSGGNTAGQGYGEINVMASLPNTVVEITPQITTRNGARAAGVPYQITLDNPGDVYQVQFPQSTDMSGTTIKSIASGMSGCQPIAVVSATTWTALNCGSGNGGDNLYQQLFPYGAWGKEFYTTPLKKTASATDHNVDVIRVYVKDPATLIKKNENGIITTLSGLNPGNFYEYSTEYPTYLLADKPAQVMEFIKTQNCNAAGSPVTPSDPEMIALSSVEQTINDITVYSSIQSNVPGGNSNVTTHYINVTMKSANTGTFKINGSVPGSAFIPITGTAYSYLKQNIPIGAPVSRLTADSGFSAIAYGFGNVESYGYNAGTNVRDLTQALEVETQYGIETSASVCTNSPFKFKLYFPDSTLANPADSIRFDSLRWDFHLASTIVPNNFPIVQIRPTIDSTNLRNGRQVNWYSIPGFYYVTTPRLDSLILTAYRSTSEGCGNEQVYYFPLPAYDPPVVSFNAPAPGCYLEPVVATETTAQLPKATYKLWWEFFDPVTNVTTVYSGIGNAFRTINHTFTTPGVKRIRHASITTPGCLSDTIVQMITLPDLPNAIIAGNTTVCINSVPWVPVTFTGSLGTAEYVFSYNINGGGTLTTPPSTGGSYTINAPTNVAGPFTYNLTGVRNAIPAGTPCTQNITGQSITVNITPDATVTLTSAVGTDNQTVCINNPIVNITYAISGSGTGGSVSGLPTGVTGSFSAGVVTITGTPVVPGIFNYTVSTTGPCVTPSKMGVINVTDDGTLALTSGAGTDNQTLCINTPILTNITYAVGGTGTGGSVSGLPAGVTGVYAGGVITIAGTPIASGVFNYTVTTTGPCVIPTAMGTITVTADGTLTLTSAVGTDNQARCINVAITNITYAVGGTGTGGSVSGLPPGVTGVYAGGVITISGTPISTAGSPYNYTVTTTGPCVIPTATGTITVNPDASIVLTSAVPTTSQELCRNATITNITYAISGGGTGATVAGLPAGVTGVYAAGVFTISGSPTVAGLFNYTVTTTGTCVQNNLSGSILVDELPTPDFSYTAPTCDTRTISFTDNSLPNTGVLTNWAWDFGDPASGAANTSNVQNPTHIFSAPNTGPGYTVTLTITTSKGCINAVPFPKNVIVNYRPQAGFIVPDVCINDVATAFTDTSKIAVGTINRPANEWNYGDPGSGPLNNSTGINGLHLYTSTGVYQVRQIVTSSLGCRDTITLPITINSADPLAAFTPANSCSSDSASITNQSTVGFGSVTRIDIYWDVAGAPGVFQTILNPIPNGIYRHKYPTLQATINYSVRIIAYSGVICFNNSAPKTLTVYATPIVQFNAMPASCLLVPPFQITQASEIGGVPGTGTYSGGPYITSTGIFDPQIAGVGTHAIKYTWTASNPGACFDTLTKFITVLDTAHATFSVVLPSCEQLPTSFTDLSTTPASVVLANTVWNFNDATPIENHAPGSSFTHTFPGPGTFTVTMHNVSAVGCLSTDTSMLITIDPNHAIALTTSNSTQTLCVNNAIADIKYQLSGGATNIIMPPAGLPPGVTASVTGGIVTLAGAPTLAGVYNYSIQTTGNTCLVATATGQITVDPDHTIAFNAGDTMQSVCINTPIDDIFYDLGGGANNVNISNLPPGVTGTVTGNILKISGTPTSTVGSPFNYLITTTGNTCVKANADGQIVVHPYPVPAFSVDKPAYCIPNAIVKFTNGSATPDGSGMTYVWTFGDGSSPDFSVNPTHWYTSGIGPFNVHLSVTSIAVPTLNGGVQGCENHLDSLMKTIHPQPKADFVFSKPSVCIGDNVIITDNTDGRDGIVNQWHWDLGDGTTEVINPLSHRYPDTATYVITMYSINSFGCNSDTINKLPLVGAPYKPFTVYPYPYVNAGPDKSVLEGGSVMLESITFANDPQYNWTPSLYLTDAHISRPRVMNPKTDMTYRLTVTARGGCSLSDDVFVKLLRFPVIPNTFSPNKDGINDTWRIDYLNTYPDNRVQIFTRTGKLVFESRGYNTPWDGTLKGKPLPFDTYYYIIEPGNGRDPITGYITILK